MRSQPRSTRLVLAHLWLRRRDAWRTHLHMIATQGSGSIGAVGTGAAHAQAHNAYLTAAMIAFEADATPASAAPTANPAAVREWLRMVAHGAVVRARVSSPAVAA